MPARRGLAAGAVLRIIFGDKVVTQNVHAQRSKRYLRDAPQGGVEKFKMHKYLICMGSCSYPPFFKYLMYKVFLSCPIQELLKSLI